MFHDGLMNVIIFEVDSSLLQGAHNLVARVVTGSFQSSSRNLLTLHWLLSEYCINFKIGNITFCSLPLSILLNLLICTQLSMQIIPLVLLDRQIPVCSPCHMSALRLASAVSELQLIQFGIISLNPSKCVPALTPAITVRPTISSRPSNPLSSFLLHLRFGFGRPLSVFKIIFIYLLTYY